MSSVPRIRQIDVVMVVAASALGAGWIIGVIPMHKEVQRRAWCRQKLRNLGAALYMYAQEGDVFPMATTSARSGEMVTFGNRHQPPDPNGTPSPTANLWMILRDNSGAQGLFTCPSSGDVPDPINDTRTAFDFAKPENLSYAYVYQYHPERQPLGPYSEPDIPLMADTNPYLKGGIKASPVDDRASMNRGNSRNHRPRDGQNVLWVHGGANFVRSPALIPDFSQRPNIAFIPADNIYTTHADGEPADPGNAPTWTRIQIGSKSDYCLVP